MKRFHIHIGVKNLNENIQFYSALFGAEPAKSKPDYAKWMLTDPLVNFAISTRSGKTGIDHLGIQVDEASEFEAFRSRVHKSLSTHDEGETVCCYTKSEKSWLEDPSRIAWETYRVMEEAQTFSSRSKNEGSCCIAQPTAQSTCCEPTETTGSCCG